MLESTCFSTPWSKAQLESALDGERVSFWGGLQGERLCAYISFYLIPPEAEIVNLAVIPSMRRQGVGLQLLRSALLQVVATGADRVFLEVRPSNRAAVALYEKVGFAVKATRRNYYPDNSEDALVMVLDISKSESACAMGTN